MDSQIRPRTGPVAGHITPLVQREMDSGDAKDEEEKETLQASILPGQSLAVGGNSVLGIRSLRSDGEPLPAATRSFMEPRFGRDFSQVRIYADSNADRVSKQLNASAFTIGPHISFAAGQYQPGSPVGNKLLAHELTHVVQQGQSSAAEYQAIQKRGTDDSTSSGESSGESTPTEEHLDEIERNYRSMIADARSDGYNVAADNLERFLDGTGGTKTIDVNWLRGFDAVLTAERTNQQRFESSLADLATELSDGETRTFNDYWDRRLTASVTEELYYASGTSTITSTGNFTLTRSGNTVTITGTVNHRWWDPYDWHAGLAAYIPGYGSVSDADALLLQEHRGAAPFDMESTWAQTLSGEVIVREYWFDSETFTWSGP